MTSKKRSLGHFIDKLLRRIPLLGKLVASIFGLLELPILEFFRRIDQRFNSHSMEMLSKSLLRGRWGGRVVPLNKNIEMSTQFSPNEEIMEIINRSNIMGVSYCYCRTIQRAFDEPKCDHPIYTCIHVGFGKSLREIPYKSKNLKRVKKDKIVEILEECDKRGLIHQLIFFPNPEFYYVICNCCPCCCVVLKKFLHSGSPHMIKSNFIAKTDFSKCTNCKVCEEWCYFGARIIKKDKLKFASDFCFGCGICVSKCPNNAITLEKI
jgi:Pyruvate/2-oxoacid:ferredoxin oxidoreductase delta subunit